MSSDGFGIQSDGFDTLLSESTVRLFGRPMYDLVLARTPEERKKFYRGPGSLEATHPSIKNVPYRSKNSFLMDQLTQGADATDAGEPEAKLARIYSFSYQNEIFDLLKPAIFLVHGDGVEVEKSQFLGAKVTRNSSLAQRAAFTERSGISSQGQGFARGIRTWLYDRADFTVRLDSETGTFDRVLLGFELGDFETGDHTRMGGGESGPPPRPGAGHGRRVRRQRFRDEY